jgi:hypothetical protein
MLWVRDVPGFEYIFNPYRDDDDDSLDFIMVGFTNRKDITKRWVLGSSTDAYGDLPTYSRCLVDGIEVAKHKVTHNC